jgi:glycerol-3-phosphate dehydrogenase
LSSRVRRSRLENPWRARSSRDRTVLLLYRSIGPCALTSSAATYGAAHRHVLALMAAEPSLCARVVPDLPVVLVQVAYAARAEMATRLADVVMRRTPVYLSRSLDRPALSA